MGSRQTLGDYIERYSQTGPWALPVAAAIDAIAAASIDIAASMSDGVSAISGSSTSCKNADGDIQKDLDVHADRVIRRALRCVPVAAIASEEERLPEIRDASARICVAVDPLDGSSNIEINMTVGTIFSIVPTPTDLSAAFQQKGAAQLAAGFVVYGPQTSLVLTLGDGVDIFTLDRGEGCFKLTCRGVRIAASAPEYAINASNRRYWEPPVRAFIDGCIAGSEGAANFNMRWIGSLVAEAYRILTRGGIFLYPADARDGYSEGRLRLVYEAHPMAFIVEQAGGAATTGYGRILDIAATSLHQRVPLIMGSIDVVRRVEELHNNPQTPSQLMSPLFAHRGFFRV